MSEKEHMIMYLYKLLENALDSPSSAKKEKKISELRKLIGIVKNEPGWQAKLDAIMDKKK